MALVCVDLEVTFKVAQAITGQTRKHFPGQANGAKLTALKIVAQSRKLLAHKRIVERDVVRHKDFPFRQLHDLLGYFKEFGCIGNHLIGDSRDLGYLPGNAPLGVEQGRKLVYNPFPIVQHDGDFGDALVTGYTPGGFNVYYCVHGYFV